MKIEPYSSIINDLVKSRNFSLKNFSRKIPCQNTSKNLTYLDVMVFHQYADSKRLDAHLDNDALQKLFRKKGRNFVNGALSFFMKNYNYPSDLKPRIIYNVKVDAPMGFVPVNNTIFVNEDKLASWSPREILIAFRHEFRHFEQFLTTFRCAPVRFDVVDFYATQNVIQKRLNELYSVHKSVKPNEKFDIAGMYLDCQKYFKEHPDDEEIQEKRKHVERYRQKVLKKYGWITPYTADSERAVQVFEAYKKQILNPIGLGGYDFLSYQTSFPEYDAYLSQKLFANQISADKKCLFSELKQSNQGLLQACTSDAGLCGNLSKDLKSSLMFNEELLINFLHND